MKSLSSYLSTNISDPMRKDHVFVIIKPGFYNLADKLFAMFAEYGYKIVKSKTKRLTLSEAEELYKMHKKEDFYESLCKYMSSDITKLPRDVKLVDAETLKFFLETILIFLGVIIVSAKKIKTK